MNNSTNMKIFADVALMRLSRSHCRFERMALCSVVHGHWWWINFKLFSWKNQVSQKLQKCNKKSILKTNFFHVLFFLLFRRRCTAMSQWYENQKKMSALSRWCVFKFPTKSCLSLRRIRQSLSGDTRRWKGSRATNVHVWKMTNLNACWYWASICQSWVILISSQLSQACFD